MFYKNEYNFMVSVSSVLKLVVAPTAILGGIY